MRYQEPLETAKPYKEAYLAGLTRLIEEKQAEAATQRRAYAADIFTDPARYRKELRALLGWPLTEPAPTSLPAVKAEKLSEEEGYTVYRLQFEILPGVNLAGLFFRMDGNEPMPLVLTQHGKLGTPERISGVYGSTSNYNHMLSRIIAHGVHAFAPQLCLWSDSYEVPFNREELDARLKRVGSSIAAVEIYGLTRILDYFEQQDYVSGLGMAGMSYGGFYTLMTTALDTRLRAAICCSYFNKRDAVPWSDWVWFGSGLKFDDAQLACLIYPRNFYILMGDRDPLFDYRNTVASYEEAKALREDEWLHLHIYDGNHEFCKDDAPIESFIRDLKED